MTYNLVYLHGKMGHYLLYIKGPSISHRHYRIFLLDWYHQSAFLYVPKREGRHKRNQYYGMGFIFGGVQLDFFIRIFTRLLTLVVSPYYLLWWLFYWPPLPLTWPYLKNLVFDTIFKGSFMLSPKNSTHLFAFLWLRSLLDGSITVFPFFFFFNNLETAHFMQISSLRRENSLVLRKDSNILYPVMDKWWSIKLKNTQNFS